MRKAHYTVRYAHLKGPSHLKAGSFVKRGDMIGVMGSTGKSTGAHLHIDVTRGINQKMFRLSDMGAGNPAPDMHQLNLFIDEELGAGPFRVTTYPYDYRYVFDGKWKAHPGYDLVVETGSQKLYWNRSMSGRVVLAGYDVGYGNYVCIAFKA